MGIFKNLQKIAIRTPWNRHWRFQNPVSESNRDSRARIFNGNAINAAKVLYRLADA
jgi:hypothetical protein